MGETRTNLDTDLIRALADVMRDTDLAEIEVKQDEDGGFRVRLSRAPTIPYATAAPAPVIAPAEPPRALPAQDAPQLAGAGAAPAAADLARHPGVVPSPMVGTVYRSAEPGARAFVEPGDRVSEGQTILIIEAMKHMNEVQSPRAGTITAVLVEDGQPVEYGEPLVVLE